MYYFFFPFEQQGHNVHKLQKKKKERMQSVGALQLEHDDRKGTERGDSSNDNLLKQMLNCFQQSEMCFLSVIWCYRNNDSWKCIMSLLFMVYQFNVVWIDKHSTKDQCQINVF